VANRKDVANRKKSAVRFSKIVNRKKTKIVNRKKSADVANRKKSAVRCAEKETGEIEKSTEKLFLEKLYLEKLFLERTPT